MEEGGGDLRIRIQLRKAWSAVALCGVMVCHASEPRVSVPLTCKPSRECALQMAQKRARAEVKAERYPTRFTDTVARLAAIVASTDGAPDQLDPLLAELKSELSTLSGKERDSFMRRLSVTQNQAGRYHEALETVRKIRDVDERDQAWFSQAMDLTRAARVEQAIQATAALSNPKARDEARLTIINVLGQEGHPELARQAAQLLGLATDGHGAITLGIAVAEANGGNDVEARRLADTLNLNGRALVLREIIDNEVRRKKADQALLSLQQLRATLLQVDKGGPRFDPMCSQVVRELGEAGFPEAGLDLVSHMSPDWQPGVLANIAGYQARAGEIEAAVATAHRIPEANAQERDSAMSDIAAARAAAGTGDPVTALSEIHDPGLHTHGLCAAARMLAGRKQEERAREFLKASIASAPLPVFPPVANYTVNLSDVVRTQVELGFFADALAAADHIPHGIPRVWAFRSILQAQAARGLRADAGKTLESALTASAPGSRGGEFYATLQIAAEAGLAAEALKAARLASDPIDRELAWKSIAVPLAEQGQLDDAFAAAADVRYDSSDVFVKLFEVLSQKGSRTPGI